MYAYEFVTKGILLGKVCLKRVLPPVDVIDVTPLWRQPPLNSAERERLATLERVVEGLPQDAIDGGWTAVGIIAYAKSLQSELAALRQAQQGPSTAANSTAMADNDLTAALCDLAYANGAGNSPVIPDVPRLELTSCMSTIIFKNVKLCIRYIELLVSPETGESKITLEIGSELFPGISDIAHDGTKRITLKFPNVREAYLHLIAIKYRSWKFYIKIYEES
ncbi:hypothetical protein [Dickeya fangzhongdai]|uniref:hypothetical protein n=1 Tax=Dickeya fangzhongdai TaxID=1778540 RepID=UPI002B25F610|nr:hypothetical protein [Dickeya fangzhongdai]WOY03090.1 hypothetical protein OGM21_14520 [Dickeya fangzhongdai]